MKRFLQFIVITFVIMSITAQSEETDSENEKVDITPKILALVRAKAEQNLSIQNMNFMVRNARFGVKGRLTHQISYKIEIDWMDKEDIDMNDAKIIYSPIKVLEFTIGQFKVPFANDYHRNPADYSFANRNFITKRIMKNLRDVGVMAGYSLPFKTVPTKLELGIFNGNSSNTFEHDLYKAVAGKISISPFKNSFLTFSGYNGEVTLDKVSRKHIMAEMLGASFTQNIGNFFIDIEGAYKGYKDSLKTKYWAAFGVLAYDIPIANSSLLKITPAIRFDMQDRNHDFLDESPRRISAGVTFHLKENNNSYFRLDFEKYSYKSGFKSESDMITLEYVIRY